jgi:hypothetical protein
MQAMSDTPVTATFIIRVVHEPAGGVSGVVERVRTGIKEQFQGREAFCRLMDRMLAKQAEDEPPA